MRAKKYTIKLTSEEIDYLLKLLDIEINRQGNIVLIKSLTEKILDITIKG